MKKNILQQLKKALGEKLKQNESLKKYTTFNIGGEARFFYEAENLEDLLKVLETALSLKIPYLILGSGSNILISDRGYQSLVIKNKSSNLSFIKDMAQCIADSGVPLSKLIIEAASYDLGGLEFLYGIPGTVGGAIVSNAGSLGSSIGDFVISLTLDYPKKGIKKVSGHFMKFDYRDSQILHDVPRPIVLSVRLQLFTNRKEEILRKIQHYKKIREKAYPADFSAGSFFKNPKVDKDWAKRYFKQQGEMDNEILETIEKTGRIPAGWLLEQIEAFKIKVGHARVSKKHANFLINHKGKAKAEDIRKLASMLKEKVYEKFDIVLKEEVEYLGDW